MEEPRQPAALKRSTTYHELTGPIPSELPFAGGAFVPGFFGDWDRERLDREILQALQSRDAMEPTDFQLRRHTPVPPGEPLGLVFRRPHPDCGMAVAVRTDPPPEEIVAFYPHGQIGMQHRVELRRAHVMPDGITAVLEGHVLLPAGRDEEPDRLHLYFHDGKFCTDRGFYRKGLINDFILYAYVGYVEAAENRVFKMKREDLEGSGFPVDRGSDDVAIHLEEAVWFLQNDDNRIRFDFRALITSVQPVLGESDWESRSLQRSTTIFGVRVWRVRALLTRHPDFELDLIISDAIGGTDKMLVPGRFIEGNATLGGYCWY